MSPITLNLRSTEADARALAANIKAEQPNCVLIMIDTLARNFAGGNENAPDDMGAFVARIALLEQLTGAFVCLVHHSGKDESKGLRGHTSLIGAIDFAGELKRDIGKMGLIQITKLRDGQDGAQYGYDIASVELGIDEDGDTVTAPVAIDITPEEARAVRDRKPQGRNQEIIFAAFDQFVVDCGGDTPIGTGFPEPGRVKAVDDAAFQEFAAGKMGHTELKYRARAVTRGLDGLIDRKLLVRNGGVLWKM